jgi:transposase-like protein
MKWDYETKTLLAMCLRDGMSIKAAARVVGCTYDQAVYRARAMGLRSGLTWCDDADDMLRLGWRVLPDEELAASLRKSVGAIRNRARVLGLPLYAA